MLRLLRLISLRQLYESWGRTLLVVGGTATGVALIVAIDIVNTTVLANFRRTIELMAGPAALEVTLGVGEIGFAESTVSTVRADPDVAAAVPLVRGTISLATDPNDTLELVGTDLTAEEDLERYHVRALTERRELVRVMEDARSILLTDAFAARHALAVGDRVSLATPAGVDAFTVRGLIENAGVAAALGGRLAVMDLPAAQSMLGKLDRVDQIDVILRPGAATDTVQARLAGALPTWLTVGRPAQRGAQYDSVLASYQTMVTGISALCLVVGLFIVYNTTSTSAVHRAAIIPWLQVIGAERSVVVRLLMIEAVIVGTLGSVVGVIAGVAVARFLIGLQTEAMGVIFQLRFPVESFVTSGRAQILNVVIGVAATVFASSFAARRIGRLDPVAVLRGDLGTGRGTPPARLVLWWAVLVLASAAALFAQAQLKSAAWGNVGSTIWYASVILIAIPFVTWSAAGFEFLLTRIFPGEGRIAAAALSRSPGRAGVTTAAIAFVLGLSITVDSLVMSFRTSIANYVERFLGGDLIVSARTTEGGWLETPLPEGVVDDLRAVDGVRAVESWRVLPGQLYRGERIGVLAMTDGFFDAARYGADWYREGDPQSATAALRAGEGAVVSTGLADRFGLHVGERIELVTPSGPLALPIVGVTPDYVSNRGSVILSRAVFKQRWLDDTVSRVNVFAAPGVSLEDLRTRILNRVGERYRVKVLSLRDARDYQIAMVNRAFASTDTIKLLVIIVTIAGIFDLLVARIVERRRELALWRVIGAADEAVRRAVVLESTTIGAMGTALGIPLGLVTAWIWIRLNFRYLLGYDLETHLSTWSIAQSAALVMVLTLATGWFAARYAVRQSVLDGIQAE